MPNKETRRRTLNISREAGTTRRCRPGRVPAFSRGQADALTVKCWNSQARRMLVATFGKMPLFLWFFFPESSSSSPVPSPLPMLALLASPGKHTRRQSVKRRIATYVQHARPHVDEVCAGAINSHLPVSWCWSLIILRDKISDELCTWDRGAVE